VPVGFMFAILYFVGMSIEIAAGGGHDPNPAVVAIIVILFVLFGLAVGLLISLVQVPLILRAGLSQELGFDGAFASFRISSNTCGKRSCWRSCL